MTNFKDPMMSGSQAMALADYIGGWEETHEVGDLTLMEAYSVLRIDYANTEYDNYTEDGIIDFQGRHYIHIANRGWPHPNGRRACARCGRCSSPS